MAERSCPHVESLSWGSIRLDDGRSFKDVKLYPGGAREWDWSETGTQHKPGIQPEDVAELLENGATVVVLGRGMWGRLEVQEATLETLRAAHVRAEVFKSKEAVQRYNQLVGEQAVGALIHSTC